MKAHVRAEAFGLLDSWETCPELKVSKIVITINILVQGPLEGYGAPCTFRGYGVMH